MQEEKKSKLIEQIRDEIHRIVLSIDRFKEQIKLNDTNGSENLEIIDGLNKIENDLNDSTQKSKMYIKRFYQVIQINGTENQSITNNC